MPDGFAKATICRPTKWTNGQRWLSGRFDSPINSAKQACTYGEKVYVAPRTWGFCATSANTSLTLSLPGNRLVGADGGSNDKPEGVIMRLYESVLIARQDITAAQVETMADEFAEIITSAGGSIKKREYWGLRALAYRIKKNRKGHYVMFNLETGPEALKEYERIMGLNEDVLRFLNIRIEEVEEGPSIMMQVKTERPTRGGRDDRDDRDSGERNSGKAESNDSAAGEKSED
jgi:small subunit ribosomal protein S6